MKMLLTEAAVLSKGGDVSFKALEALGELTVYENMSYKELEENIKDYDVLFCNKLSIDKNIIDSYGEYSVNTIYELSNSLLEHSTADIVVFTLGDKNHDICYMCIGDIDGIHVYKNKINIKDDNMVINLTKTAIFYLIRKLKQNNLQFI